jgi:hypothetical protein
MTTYHEINGDHWGFDDLQSEGPNQRLDVLLSWHIEDLPSGYEMARNDYLDSLQQNRNPFVDSAHFACFIDFRTMEYISTPDSSCLAGTIKSAMVDTSDSTVGVGELPLEDRWIFYPNPAQGALTIGSKRNLTFDVVIYSTFGQLMLAHRQLTAQRTIDISTLSAGVYSVWLKDDIGDYSFRLIKE